MIRVTMDNMAETVRFPLAGGPVVVPIVGSLAFDGDGSQLMYAAGAAVPADGDGAELSVAGWVYLSSGGQNANLFNQETLNTTFAIYVSGGNLKVNDSLASNIASVSEPSSGAWHHIGLTWKNYITGVQFSDWHLYIDGAEVAASGPADTTQWASSGDSVDFGKFNDANIFPLAGNMVSWGVFNSIINSTVMAGLHARTTDPSTLSPSALWGMQDGSGTNVADSSGNNHDATIDGTHVTWSASHP